jgi:hypothetical protein
MNECISGGLRPALAPRPLIIYFAAAKILLLNKGFVEIRNKAAPIIEGESCIPEEKRKLVTPRRRWEDLICLAQDAVH